MALAIVLVALVISAVLFHAFSPWWYTPLASNWALIDTTLSITLLITGAVFIAVNVFIAWCIVRFRHRDGHRAAFQPDNRRLERWLIALTGVGIAAMLTPGLFVYADLIRPPPSAAVIEAIGQQWQWRFRLPGPDGQLGSTDVRFIGPSNPFGLNPADPRGRDDILISEPEVHVQVNQPVKILLRSQDVLHDFFVQPFRTRMNMVPGMVTSFWLTPTKTGRYEILCAQLCGVGHFNMRGHVVVDDETGYRAWLGKQRVTLASFTPPPRTTSTAMAGGSPTTALVSQGQALAQSKGCVACHSPTTSAGVGPGWQGLYGKHERLAGGTMALVDEAYLREAITVPNSKLVEGFQPVMPKIDLNDQEVNALIAYIRSLSTKPAATTAQQ
ncbi:cytochrome c oxidase subunit II [Jeongeupia naejangsanensis]|uniref:cytochrome-c oxidase n=1 Tax=Jeongeupia naejangsanensis TaxID=613195 RepID=A0ABS2BFW7_9NEIS|nr:cytochrome c oxidase subunit II [Jeongeupia naejangsanensis]MBM3114498.1 cytochrome c oxidase subunit II [Jeongeupia naejangsanensis]